MTTNKTIAFTIPIVPTAQKRARHGRLRNGASVTYKDQGQRQNENNLIALMAPYAPETPWEGPVLLSVGAHFPIPASWSKRKREQALDNYGSMTSKPDIDNVVKQAADILTKLQFWLDDKQMVCLIAEKGYSDKPRWEITLKHLV